MYLHSAERLLVETITTRDWSVTKGFIKYEALIKKDPVFRLILALGIDYNTMLGRFIKHAEHTIYQSITDSFSVCKYPIIFKGMNALEQGRCIAQKWARFEKPLAYSIDAKRFDQHVSYWMLREEFRVYLQLVEGSDKDQLAWLLSKQLRNNIKLRAHDGTIKTQVLGQRMTGTMNTGLGNCILAVALAQGFCLNTGVPKHELIVNGDDVVIIVESPGFTVDSLKNWYRGYGFDMKVDAVVSKIEHVQFCQTQPVFVGPSIGDYLMVRNPKRAFVTDSICKFEKTSRGFQSWSEAVGTAGLSLYGSMPLFREFYKFFQRNGLRGKMSHPTTSWWVRHLATGLDYSSSNISDKTRLSFHEAFGVPPHVQFLLEEHLSQLRLESGCSTSNFMDIILGC
jgi:hypothetical protein